MAFLLDNLQCQDTGQNRLRLAQLKLSSQMTNLQDIPIGDIALQLEKLQLDNQANLDIEFQNIQYQGQTNLAQDLFTSTADFNFSQLLLAGETLKNGRLKLTLSGINAEILQSLQQTAKEMQQKAFSQQSSPFGLQLQLLGLYSQLLNSGITLTLEELSLHSANGELNGKGNLSLLNEIAEEVSFLSLENIAANFYLEIDQD